MDKDAYRLCAPAGIDGGTAPNATRIARDVIGADELRLVAIGPSDDGGPFQALP